MIAIFLNRKIITCDTIIAPILRAGAIWPGRKIVFYCFDQRTFETIKRNYVISDAIDKVGEVRLIGTSLSGTEKIKGVARLLKAATAIRELLYLLLRCILTKTTFIHFKQLNDGPLRILYRCNKSRTIFWEGSAAGYGLTEENVDNAYRQRVRYKGPRSAGILVHYSDNWTMLKNANFVDIPRHRLPTCYISREWAQFIEDNQARYFEEAFRKTGCPPSEHILTVMGGAGFLGELDMIEDTTKDLLIDIFDALLEYGNGIPVFFKPPPVADPNSLHIFEKIIARYKGRPLFETNLHPAVLATRSVLFAATNYSTTFSVASRIGVPTIEYTRYTDKVLEITEGGSVRTDYVSNFIQNDKEALQQVVSHLVSNLEKTTRSIPYNPPGVEDGFLAHI